MAQEPLLNLSCDDFYLSALFSEVDELDDDQIFPISDVKYAQGLQFQEAVMASTMQETSQNSLNNAAAAASSSMIQESQSWLMQPEEAEECKVETGESSLNFCEICVERKESEQMFTIESCRHLFCNDCIGNHVAARLQYNTRSIACPVVECEGLVEFDSCSNILPKDVLERWGDVLCESLILASQQFYCPFQDCSAMLVRDTDEVIRESECPLCWRLFCAQCRVPWHPGIECEEFQRLNEDEREREDLLLRELVKEKSWNRCPSCKYYVEKTEGCLHMTCRCGSQFCYACGETWSSTHGGCQRT